MRVRFGGTWIADSEDVLLLFEPGHYPMACFRETDISSGALEPTGRTTRHPDLGLTSWYTVRAGDKSAARAAWQHTDLPIWAQDLQARVAFAWPAMDAFYEQAQAPPSAARDSHRTAFSRVWRRSLARFVKRRAHPGPRRGQLSPHRHSPVLPQPCGPAS
jgi:uncharacterized protein (DUF427 family)